MSFSKLTQTATCFDETELIWRGPQQEFTKTLDAFLGQLILEALLAEPDHISQICDNNGREYTNKEIALMSIRVAQHLEEIGLEQEDVIGICSSNTDFLAPLVLGSLLCGTILSPLDSSFDEDGIRHIFSITQPKVMFCDGKVYTKVLSSLSEINPLIPIFTMKDHLDGVRRIDELIATTGREKRCNMRPLKLGQQQTAVILSSSGTTGLPKGVCVSHESILRRKAFQLSSDDKLLCFSTIYWISGYLSLIHGTLSGCTRIITDQVYSPELFLRMVEKYKVNVVLTPPSQMSLAIQSPDIEFRDISSLELYLVGGSAVPFAVIQSFQKYVKNCQIISGYGMTELSGMCSYGLPSKPSDNGQLYTDLQVKILNESGNKLGICEKGEVYIKPPNKWSGYYRNKDATESVYDQDGWIHSGDIGYFDERGSLFIFDRKKDILKYNNFHFFPTEIEQVIVQLADVNEVCVCGIPDVVSSFLPAAAVVKLQNSKLTEADVITYVAEKMAHFKQLRGGVYFLDALPKTASGKIIRYTVTQICKDLFEQRNKC